MTYSASKHESKDRQVKIAVMGGLLVARVRRVHNVGCELLIDSILTRGIQFHRPVVFCEHTINNVKAILERRLVILSAGEEIIVTSIKIFEI